MQLTRWHDDAALFNRIYKTEYANRIYKTGVQSLNRFSRSDELVVDPIHQLSRIQTLMQLVTNWDELQCSSGPSGTIGAGQKYCKQYNRVKQCCDGKCQAECSAVRKVFVEISDCVTACYAV